MIYTLDISKYNSWYRASAVPKLRINAFHRLQAFPLNTTEKLIDTYLKENYHITLKSVCYLVILNCSIEEQGDQLVVTLLDKNLDKLARIITYGTGKFSGSRILPFIFNKL